MECDLVVLGSGPGGYPAAIRAAQLGASVVIVEQAETVGGTCLNVGCIPTKAMVQSAHAFNDAQGHFAQLGVRVGNVDLDFEQVQSNRRGIVDGVVKGLAGLLKANGVQVVKGRGRFSGPNTLAVEGGEDVHVQERRDRDRLAPGGPADPGHRPPALHRLDRRARAGRRAAPPRRARRRRDRRRVRVDLRAVRLGGHGRRDAPEPDRQRGRRRGRRAPARLPPPRHRRRARRAGDGSRGARRRPLAALRDRAGENKQLEADVVLVATGRVANVEDIGLERLGVTAEPRRIPVDSHMRTNVAAHLRRRRRRGQLAARAHRLPRGRGRGRERARPRLRDRLPLDAALRLHRPGDRVGRPLRGAGARAARRARRDAGRCPTRRSRARRCTATAPAS